MRKQIRKAAAIVAAGMLSLTMAAGVMPNTASAAELNDAGKKAKKAAADGIVNLDEGSEYHAYLLFQARESWDVQNSLRRIRVLIMSIGMSYGQH